MNNNLDYFGRQGQTSMVNPNQGVDYLQGLLPQNANPIMGANNAGYLAGQNNWDMQSNLWDQQGFDFNNYSGINTTPLQKDNSFWDSIGSNMGNISKGIQGVAGLGQLYLGYEGLNQAKDEFKFNKGIARENLARQAKTYNNDLYRIGRAKASSDSSRSKEEVDALAQEYVDKRKL